MTASSDVVLSELLLLRHRSGDRKAFAELVALWERPLLYYLRRLLDYVGVPFEDSCLRFYETSRAIYTPSSEQVRRPIDAAKNEEWRAFDRWLGPLKDGLGPVLDAYPEVPRFDAD